MRRVGLASSWVLVFSVAGVFGSAVAQEAVPRAGAVEASLAELTPQVEAIFNARCTACHGPANVRRYDEAKGGFDYVLDLDRLAAARKLVSPGDPEGSKLYSLVASDEMPAGAKVFAEEPVPDAEKEVIRQWIAALGADQLAGAQDFISDADILAAIEADLATLPAAQADTTRYVSMAHLHNGGEDAGQLEIYRQGITKLVNSLSWQPEVVEPVAVGPANTLIRIDLPALGWSAGLWQDIASFNLNEYSLTAAAFNILGDQDRARSYGKATAMGAFRFADAATERYDHPAFGFLKADWFAFVTARPPLYHDILNLPGNAAALEKRLGVDRRENIAEHRVMRAAVADSGVSLANRLVERHDAEYGAYWISYDFAENVGTQDLFAHPLGPYGSVFSAFRHDAGEIIFNLPNGFQAYLLATDEGFRVDTAPQAIVQDSLHPNDSTVINGASCIACHADGMNAITDEIRPYVLAADTFSAAERDEILAIYPEDAVFQAALRGDKKRFQDALAAAGVDPGLRDSQGNEPTTSLIRRFERPVGYALAAAEFGLTTEQFAQRVNATGNVDLADINNRLNATDLPREQFVTAFVTLAKNIVEDSDFTVPELIDPAAADILASLAPAVPARERLTTQGPSNASTAFNSYAPAPSDTLIVIGDKALTAYRAGDYGQAFDLWRVRADAGDPLAQFNLAVMFDRGEGTDRDTNRAVAWYHIAAEQGVVAAQYQLGIIYSEGLSVPADHDMAVYWLSQAAARGHATARNHVQQIRAQVPAVPATDAGELSGLPSQRTKPESG